MALEKNIQEQINYWLSDDFDTETQNALQELIASQNEEELTDSFYKNLAFGTGGLRGIMGVGANRINKYTIGKATQGFANYLKKTYTDQTIKVAIAYDSRNNSKAFAQITADVFAANGITVYIYHELRPTPQLSFTIREMKCQGGVVLTASHNPKEYNGYKAYGSDGGQLVAPADQQVIDEVNAIASMKEVLFSGNSELIHVVGEELDQKYRNALKSISLDNGFVKEQKNLKIAFSSIHGTGITQVPPTLSLWGFENVHIVEEQAEANGNFPTVVYPNPEEQEAMTLLLNQAKEIDADLGMACDPDADRVGLVVKNHKGEFVLLNGNQIGALLCNYILTRKKEDNALQPGDYMVRTIVTTDLIDQIGKSMNVPVFHTLTGFKYIGQMITEKAGNERFLVGGEESYGFMVGELCRDKDAISACAFLAEMTAYYKSNGKSLFEALTDIYAEHGFYKEKLKSLTKKGKKGAEEITQLMDQLRQSPSSTLGGEQIETIIDYQKGEATQIATNATSKVNMEKSNVLQFITKGGSTVSVRPSGTEPKIKFYCSAKAPFGDMNGFDALNDRMDEAIDKMINDLVG